MRGRWNRGWDFAEFASWYQPRGGRERHRHGRDWAGFGPWGRLGKFFDSGEVRLALLSLLESEPKHGYQLIKDMEERSGGLYRASAGVVYPTLQQLEDEGLVTSESKDGKRVYTLTDAGRTELGREKERVDRIWQRAESCGSWAPAFSPEGAMIAAAGGMVIKAAVATFARAEGDHEVAAKIRDILDRTRREIEELKPSA
jgi:DNA-binding PadR family transcriptional regulator